MLNRIRVVVAALVVCFPVLAQAAVELGRTRLVISEGDPSAQSSVMRLKNPTQGPVLVQSWVEDFTPQPAPVAADKALFVSPPLMRIEPGNQGFVRVVPRAVADLPRDRESIFYLHIHGIPQSESAEGKSQLMVSVVSQLKVFYRPKGLAGTPAAAVDGLKWVLAKDADGGRVLRVSNDAAYAVSIATNVRLRNAAGEERTVPVNANTFPPRSQSEFPIPAEVAALAGDEAVLFGYLDDLGTFHEVEAKLGAPAAAR